MMSTLKFLARSLAPFFSSSLTPRDAGYFANPQQIDHAAGALLPLRQPSIKSSYRGNQSYPVAPATPRIALKGLL
jgi:hypothetical protein